MDIATIYLASIYGITNSSTVQPALSRSTRSRSLSSDRSGWCKKHSQHALVPLLFDFIPRRCNALVVLLPDEGDNKTIEHPRNDGTSHGEFVRLIGEEKAL